MIVEEFIGNGANWNVKRISITHNGKTTSVIHKESIKNTSVNPNIVNYNEVTSSKLPTLSFFRQKTIDGVEVIEAEDLNPINCDGFYVSPNTAKNSPSCASEIVKFLDSSNKKNTISNQCKQFDISEYLRNPERISDDLDKLHEIRILQGAEKYVYENKIKTISNFSHFLNASKTDMKIATNNKIELFSDAFFFRVSASDNKIDYKIADFDCINLNSDIDKEELLSANKSYFETSLWEFIDFFIDEKQREIYKTELKNVW